MKLPRHPWLWFAAAGLIVLGIVPSCVRTYRVLGVSDAPSYLMGDLIVANRVAYDLRFPYTDVVLLAHSDPRPGDVVLYRMPGDAYSVFKRVVGCPGDVVAMQEHRLTVNGEPLRYEAADRERHADPTGRTPLGSVVEIESGHGPPHPITYSSETSQMGSFEPVEVPPAHYFLLGDNRDHSRDSRDYGPVPRSYIRGKVSRPLSR